MVFLGIRPKTSLKNTKWATEAKEWPARSSTPKNIQKTVSYCHHRYFGRFSFNFQIPKLRRVLILSLSINFRLSKKLVHKGLMKKFSTNQAEYSVGSCRDE
jgi:hypothetical protein